MPIFKATLFYGFRKSGASASFYSLPTSFADHAAALRDFQGSVTPAFAALMGEDVVIEGVRVSDITVRGDSRVISDGGLCGNNGKYNIVQDYAPNDGNSCIVLNWNNGALHKGRTFLRMYPDIVGFGGKYSPGTRYAAAVETFRSKLENHTWGFLAKASNAVFRITAVATTGTAPNNLVITAPGHTVAAGTPFRLSGMLPKSGSPNTTWIAADVTGSQITAEASSDFNGYTWKGKGTVAPLAKTVYLPLNVDVLTSIRTRKSGRPFDSAVGRRKVASV